MRIPALPQPKITKQKVSFWKGIFRIFHKMIVKKRHFVRMPPTKR